MPENGSLQKAFFLKPQRLKVLKYGYEISKGQEVKRLLFVM